MATHQRWYLITYDIRDPKRWRKAYTLLKGHGERIQYSIFRCQLSHRGLEQLRWELEEILDPEDNLLFIGLCAGCVQRVRTLNPPTEWPEDDIAFEIF